MHFRFQSLSSFIYASTEASHPLCFHYNAIGWDQTDKFIKIYISNVPRVRLEDVSKQFFERWVNLLCIPIVAILT